MVYLEIVFNTFGLIAQVDQGVFTSYSIAGVPSMFSVPVAAMCLDSNVENFNLDAHDPSTLVADNQPHRLFTQKYWSPI